MTAEENMQVKWRCLLSKCQSENITDASDIHVSRWFNRGPGWLILFCPECKKFQKSELDELQIRSLQADTFGQVHVHTIKTCKELEERYAEIVQIEPFSAETRAELTWQLEHDLVDDELRELEQKYRGFVRGKARPKSRFRT